MDNDRRPSTMENVWGKMGGGTGGGGANIAERRDHCGEMAKRVREGEGKHGHRLHAPDEGT